MRFRGPRNRVRSRRVSLPTSTVRRARIRRGLSAVEGPELVFGVVGPLGSNLSLVIETLRKELSNVNYKTRVIQLSKQLHDIAAYEHLKSITEEDKRIEEHMNCGDDLRQKLSRGDAMALLGVKAIRRERKELSGDEDTPATNTAYILRSLKRPEETETLRKVYGKGYIQISAHVPENERIRSLATAIAESYNKVRKDGYEPQAHKLIDRDEAAEITSTRPRTLKFGQDVRDTFPISDVIIDARTKHRIQSSLSRFVGIQFGYPFHTPTQDEYGMFFAKATALRSADLSRQVGVAIMTDQGDLLSVGYNEVPKAGGGFYGPEDGHEDHRDFQLEHDSNSDIKEQMLKEIIERLQASGWLSAERSKCNIGKLVEEALWEGDDPPMRRAQLMNILEFGRPVHAEMAALINAAKLGISVKGATLYCTTFPCHMCAKHIVAADIDRVVYIEPYPKSLAPDLFRDSIKESMDGNGSQKFVMFEPFVGIAPLSYVDVFTPQIRSDRRGRITQWDVSTARPRLQRLFLAYIEIEKEAVKLLKRKLEKAGL